jgi:hypothetical protein
MWYSTPRREGRVSSNKPGGNGRSHGTGRDDEKQADDVATVRPLDEVGTPLVCLLERTTKDSPNDSRRGTRNER